MTSMGCDKLVNWSQTKFHSELGVKSPLQWLFYHLPEWVVFSQILVTFLLSFRSLRAVEEADFWGREPWFERKVGRSLAVEWLTMMYAYNGSSLMSEVPEYKGTLAHLAAWDLDSSDSLFFSKALCGDISVLHPWCLLISKQRGTPATN